MPLPVDPDLHVREQETEREVVPADGAGVTSVVPVVPVPAMAAVHLPVMCAYVNAVVVRVMLAAMTVSVARDRRARDRQRQQCTEPRQRESAPAQTSCARPDRFCDVISVEHPAPPRAIDGTSCPVAFGGVNPVRAALTRAAR